MCISIFAIAFNLIGPNVMAQEACIVPTLVGNAEFPEGWISENGCICTGGAPNIIKSLSEEETLPRNSSTTVWVDSGGKACPPYNWTISGTGFHFDSATGPTTATTTDDLQSVNVWADDTACGAGTISVSDSCKVTQSVEIRSQYGSWVLVSDSVNPEFVGERYFSDWGDEKIVGKYLSYSRTACGESVPEGGCLGETYEYKYLPCPDPMMVSYAHPACNITHTTTGQYGYMWGWRGILCVRCYEWSCVTKP